MEFFNVTLVGGPGCGEVHARKRKFGPIIRTCGEKYHIIWVMTLGDKLDFRILGIHTPMLEKYCEVLKYQEKEFGTTTLE
jgi:hypothetical protein